MAPGQAYTYTWKVSEEFAPTESDSSCLTSMYHSHVNAPKDIAAGLIGMLLICKKGNIIAVIIFTYSETKMLFVAHEKPCC